MENKGGEEEKTKKKLNQKQLPPYGPSQARMRFQQYQGGVRTGHV
jgi:hypothetical protein